MIQSLLEARAKKCTKFCWFFGLWENLVFCFRDLLTFSKAQSSKYNFLCILQMNSFLAIFPKFFNAFASIVSIVVFPSVQKFVIIWYSSIEIFEINMRIWSWKYSGEIICLAHFFFWFHQCSNVHWSQVFQNCVLEIQRI